MVKEFWGFLIDGCLYCEEQVQNEEKKRKFLKITLETSLSLCMKEIGGNILLVCYLSSLKYELNWAQ